MSNIARPSNSFIGNSGGASAIEFAIVFPIFLLLALGLCAYGMYLGAAHSTQQLAADAARASIAGLDTAERAALTREYVSNNAASYPLIDPTKLSVQASQSQGDSRDFTVVLIYDASALPIWGFQELLPLPSQSIKRVAVIRRGSN